MSENPPKTFSLMKARTWKGALFVGAVGDLHFRISKNCQVKTFEA